MKTIEDIRRIANDNPIAWLATSIDNRPHVRGLFMWFADETGFYFHTGEHKRLYGQLRENPHVEIAFNNPGREIGQGSMARVSGAVEFVSDPELEKRLFEERPWLNQMLAQFPDSRISIFRIAGGEAQYWDVTVNGREQDQAPILF